MMTKHQIIPPLMGMLALTAWSISCQPMPPPVATLSTPQEIRNRIDLAEAPLTLVHLWATWCQPCREEFPELLDAYDKSRESGLNLLLVSADNPEDLDVATAFLREQNSPVGSLVATRLDQAFMELLSTNWSGALPASFFFDASGTLVAEWEGKRSQKEYEHTIQQLLNP